MKTVIKGLPVALVGITISVMVFVGCAKPSPAPGEVAPTPESPLKWLMPTVWGPGFEAWTTMESFTERVKERSGGRLEIELLPFGEMIGVMETFDAVKSGAVPIVQATPIYYSGPMPEAAIEYGLPFDWLNMEEFYYWYYKGGLQEQMRQLYRQHNIYELTADVEMGFAFLSTKPVRSLGDFKGVIVAVEGGMDAAMASAVGATPIYMSFTEMDAAMKLGTIDMVARMKVAFVAYKGYELASYVIQPAFHNTIIVTYLVNLDEWNKLPDDLKYVLEWSALEMGTAMSATEMQNGVLEEMKWDEYFTVITLPDEDVLEMSNLGMKFWDEFAEEYPELAPMLEKIKARRVAMGLL